MDEQFAIVCSKLEHILESDDVAELARYAVSFPITPEGDEERLEFLESLLGSRLAAEEFVNAIRSNTSTASQHPCSKSSGARAAAMSSLASQAGAQEDAFPMLAPSTAATATTTATATTATATELVLRNAKTASGLSQRTHHQQQRQKQLQMTQEQRPLTQRESVEVQRLQQLQLDRNEREKAVADKRHHKLKQRAVAVASGGTECRGIR